MKENLEKPNKYRHKRDFDKSPERAEEKKKKGKKPIFVIHKHDASTLHYDFRFEVDNVLKSWTIPKGPSTDPREKRLALPTEDHPLEYNNFEGIIPENQYGAGVVIIWDRGTYENISEVEGKLLSMEEAMDKGHIAVSLKGEKLQGGYGLIRTSGDNEERWLLVKMNDGWADARRNPVSTEPESIISGKTIDDLKKVNKNDGN